MSAPCPCGNREPHSTDYCRVVQAARDDVTTWAGEYGVPAATALDLWAHLRKFNDPVDAASAVHDVLDLGWRPVVGSEPKRLWTKP